MTTAHAGRAASVPPPLAPAEALYFIRTVLFFSSPSDVLGGASWADRISALIRAIVLTQAVSKKTLATLS